MQLIPEHSHEYVIPGESARSRESPRTSGPEYVHQGRSKVETRSKVAVPANARPMPLPLWTSAPASVYRGPAREAFGSLPPPDISPTGRTIRERLSPNRFFICNLSTREPAGDFPEPILATKSLANSRRVHVHYR